MTLDIMITIFNRYSQRGGWAWERSWGLTWTLTEDTSIVAAQTILVSYANHSPIPQSPITHEQGPSASSLSPTCAPLSTVVSCSLTQAPRKLAEAGRPAAMLAPAAPRRAARQRGMNRWRRRLPPTVAARRMMCQCCAGTR